MECKICGRYCKSYSSLSVHLSTQHKFNKNDHKEYYLKYLNDGKINSHSECIVCDKETEFISISAGFKKTCSKICYRKYLGQVGINGYFKKHNCYPGQKEENKEKIKSVMHERYGVDNPGQLPNHVEKMKTTNIKKYGVEYYSKTEEYKQSVINISKQKYGTNHYSKTDEFKDRVYNTKLLKYNDPFYNNLEKIKSSTFEHYGVDNYGKTEEWKLRIQKTCLEKYGVYSYPKTDEYKEKSKQVCLEKYGVEYYSQTDEWKNMFKNKLNQILEKSYLTKKKNNSFGKSKLEDKLYKILCEKYGTENVIRQYRSEVYPFNCDFYIKNLDLYIEYNGLWTHGKHPFDETNPDDLKIVEQWKQKSEEINFKGEYKKFYEAAVNTWTIGDVRKRNTAKENNLNYIEIWDLNNLNLYFQN